MSEKEQQAVNRLSGRQLAVSVTCGGLSLAAGAAGRADWRWMLVGMIPMVLLAGVLLKKKEKAAQCLRGMYGKAVEGLLCAGSLPLMADALRRGAERINRVPGEGAVVIVMAMLALPLLWISRQERAAFFRGAEVLWLAAGVTAGAVLLAGAFQVKPAYLVQPVPEETWVSVLRGAAIPGTAVFLLPQLKRTEPLTEENDIGVQWLMGLSILSAALCALTQGILSVPVCSLLEQPFFTAAGLLGKSARLEGLVSTLWLIPDLTLAGMLAAGWPGRWGSFVSVLLALGLGSCGILKGLLAWTLPAEVLVLVVLTIPLFCRGKG